MLWFIRVAFGVVVLEKVGTLFDLDYTLIENEFYPWIYQYILEAAGIKDMTIDEFRKIFFYNFRDWIRQGRYIDAFDWDKLLEYTLNKLGCRAKVSFTEAFIENFEMGRAKVLTGVKEFLRKIKDRGALVGILSNGVWRFQKITLSMTELIDLVDFVVTSDMANIIKPFREIFELGKKESMKRGARKIYFFGDSLLFDIVGSARSSYDEIFWMTSDADCFEKKPLSLFKEKIFEEMDRYGIHLDLENIWEKEIYLYENYQCLEKNFFSLNLV